MTANMNDDFQAKDELLSRLLEQAPVRPQPRTQAKDDAFRALHQQWSQQVSMRRQRQRRGVFALAATLIVGVGAVFMLPRSAPPPVQVASLARVVGPAPQIIDGNGLPLSVSGHSIVMMTGQSLATGPSTRVALAWHDGGSLRLDVGSRIEWVSDTEVRLIDGALYFDSGVASDGARHSPKLGVRTTVGVVSHLGTQYLIEQAGEQVAISVREGRISVQGEKLQEVVVAGQQIRTSGSGDPSQRAIGQLAQPWDWVASVAPPFSVKPQSTARELIDWIARETGRSVVYAPGARAEARATPLINFEALSASSSTIAVLQSATNLEFELTGDQVRVSVRTASP